MVYMMHKQLTGMRGPVGGEEDLVPIGSARVARPGRDLTVITYGFTVGLAEQAATELSGQGVDVEIIDLRTLSPLDVRTIVESVKRTGRVLVVDEAPPVAGPAAEISALVQDHAFWYLDQPVMRLTAADSPIPHSPGLVDELLPSSADIFQAALELSRAQGPQEATS